MKNGIYNIPRPGTNNLKVAKDIVNIVSELTGEWFSDDVVNDTGWDLLFHDSLCFFQDNRVLSFINYTTFDGSIRISLMATKKGLRRQGYGSDLLLHLFDIANSYGIRRIDLLTVPSRTNPLYHETIQFYIKHGFFIKQEYAEYWENGALQLEKILEDKEK